MKMLSVDEAKQALESVVDAVARGEEVVLTRHGAPVAQVTPVASPGGVGREEAIRAFLADLDRKMPIGGVDWTRDDLHGR